MHINKTYHLFPYPLSRVFIISFRGADSKWTTIIRQCGADGRTGLNVRTTAEHTGTEFAENREDVGRNVRRKARIVTILILHASISY